MSEHLSSHGSSKNIHQKLSRTTTMILKKLRVYKTLISLSSKNIREKYTSILQEDGRIQELLHTLQVSTGRYGHNMYEITKRYIEEDYQEKIIAILKNKPHQEQEVIS